MTHRLRAVKLRPGRTTSSIQLTEQAEEGVVNLYLVPYRFLESDWNNGSRYRSLLQLVNDRQHCDSPPAGQGNISGHWMTLSARSHKNIDALCRKLVDMPNPQDAFPVVTHGPVLRHLQDPYFLSQRQFTAWLILDDGDLRDTSTEALKPELSPAEAWRGCGWLNLKQRLECPEPSFDCYDDLRHAIDDEATRVAERFLLCSADNGKNPTSESINTHRRVIAHILAAYLPYYTLDLSKKKWRAYGADGETGQLPFYGPVPWSSWSDPRLGPLEQDLICEGWLAPIESVTGEWTLQPASITLLYWAARVLDLRFIDDPQQFIRHHDWKGWFGDRCNWSAGEAPL